MLNEEHTKLLRDAQRRLGKERVESFLPQPFRVFVSDHDTGCQCWIDMWAEGREVIRVWQGSIWYASCYDFNDRDKRGWNEEARFAFPTIVAFFATVLNALVDRDANSVANAEAAKQLADKKHADDLEFYASLVGEERGSQGGSHTK